MLTGFEMGNTPDRGPTLEEWQRWDALPGKVAKLRPYSLRKSTLDYIAPSHPTIIIRPDSDGGFEVADRIRELRSAIVTVAQWGMPIVCVRGASIGIRWRASTLMSTSVPERLRGLSPCFDRLGRPSTMPPAIQCCEPLGAFDVSDARRPLRRLERPT